MKPATIFPIARGLFALVNAIPVAQDSTNDLASLADFVSRTPIVHIEKRKQVYQPFVNYNDNDLDDFAFPEEDNDCNSPGSTCYHQPVNQSTGENDPDKGTEFGIGGVTLSNMKTKIPEIIYEHLSWFDSTYLQAHRETVSAWLTKAYEYVYGPDDEVAQRKLQFEVVEIALEKLNIAVREVVDGTSTRPNIRRALKDLVDDYVDKQAILSRSKSQPGPEEMGFSERVESVRLLSAEAIALLNQSYKPQPA